MAGNLVYGFLCVRLLPISEYARFVVVFGFLGTLAVFMDIGFSSALLPLIGERIDNLNLIADYIASLRQLAHWLFLLIAPATMIFYPLLVQRQHWSAGVVAAMVAILLVAVWCTRVAGTYGAVLIVRRDRKMWYRAQMVSSLGTLALLGIAWGLHVLTGFVAILLNVAGIVYIATFYFFRARHLLRSTGKASREKRKAIVHFASPNLVGILFYAFQGQIALFLITYFGHAAAVASVGALGRLGQIFVLFSQMTPLLIEPYFAKLPKTQLKRNYLGLVAVELLVCGSVTSLAHSFPGLFLWILGHNYSGLRFEVFLIMAASSVSFLSGVFWAVNNARRYVYWWNGAVAIAVTLAIQIAFIWKSNLSTVRGVLYLNLTTAAAALLINVATGLFGFVRGPRRSIEAAVSSAASA